MCTHHPSYMHTTHRRSDGLTDGHREERDRDRDVEIEPERQTDMQTRTQ